MKKWMKRSLSLAFATVMVLGLCSCGKEETDPALVAAAKENVYKYEEIPVFERIEDTGNGGADYNVYSMTYADGKIVALTNYNYWTMDSWGNEVQLISVNVDGSDKKTVKLWSGNDEEFAGTYLNNAVMSDNHAYAIMQKEDYENIDEFGMPDTKSELVCWDFEGNEKWRVSVIPEDLPEGEWFYVENLIALEEDQVLVAAMDRYLLFNCWNFPYYNTVSFGMEGF